MTTKCCPECGRIQENTIILVNKLLTKVKQRLYLWQYGDAKHPMGTSPKSGEIYEWQQALEGVLKEINYENEEVDHGRLRQSQG